MKVAVIFALAFAVLLNTAYSKDFKLKVKNAITDKEESDEINVDEDGGTETVTTSDGHLSMKDFNTGFTAIKNTETKECLIIRTDNTGDQASVADLEKDLEAIEGSKKQPEVVQEAVEDIDNTTEITDEQRTAVGQNLIDFCDDFKTVVASTEDDSDEDGIREGEPEEADDGESEEDDDKTSEGEGSEVSGRKKRALCPGRRLYKQNVCVRRRYIIRYRICARKFFSRCMSYRYVYRYTYRTYCYGRYFLRNYTYRCSKTISRGTIG